MREERDVRVNFATFVDLSGGRLWSLLLVSGWESHSACVQGRHRVHLFVFLLNHFCCMLTRLHLALRS
jgi:hypothetical protein